MLTENLGFGIHVSPTYYNPLNFEAIREIRILFSPDVRQDTNFSDVEIYENFKKEITDKLDELHNNNFEPTVPATQDIIVRCSRRSVKTNKSRYRLLFVFNNYLCRY